MKPASLMRIPLLAALTLASSALLAGNPNRPAGPPDYAVDFPAGIACSNFTLRVEGWAGRGEFRQVKDRNGFTRMLFGGTGDAWRLTNLLNGKSMTTQNNGASAAYLIDQADGSTEVDVRGHVLIIWFPSDLPPGPSASLHTGRTRYHLSAAGQGSALQMDGRSTDLCVALN